jgi:PAS domain S-box-containing protein
MNPVTEQVETLRESESRFRQIVENLREFIWLSDPAFTTHYYANAAYEVIWGRSRESLYADPMTLLAGVHPDDRARVTSALAGMLRGEYDIEFRVVRPDDDVRWVSSRGVPVRDERGEICRIAGITEDVTERTQAELERRRLLEGEREAREASDEARAIAEQGRRDLERVTESRTRLIRGFTHDVKNPLGTADGFLSLLADGVQGDLTEQQSASVARARRSIRSALDLIDHLLELARAEAGQLEIQRVPTDLRRLVSDLVEAFQAQAQTEGLSLSLEPPPELPVIESDAARVRQVLANLLSNAIKYTPDGGHVTVRAGVRSTGAAPGPGEWLAIDVADTGQGIAPEKLEMLFQEFTRFDPEAAHGSGIGLAIGQRIANALGGEISVESDVGVGSTFSLWLPLRA